jgi:CelD/BcsL family acetyltransferase involved in cellulose biosynthesis
MDGSTPLNLTRTAKGCDAARFVVLRGAFRAVLSKKSRRRRRRRRRRRSNEMSIYFTLIDDIKHEDRE